MNVKSITLVIITLIFSASANAVLVSRLGGLAYYDTEADLTWLADANAAETSMNWADANAWAAGLDIDGVAGADGWRLPDTIDVGNDGYTYTNVYQGVDYGYNITTHSELSNMFYNVLGNMAYYDTSGTFQPGHGLSNTDPFSNLQSGGYWSATEYAPDTSYAWCFNMSDGGQYYCSKSSKGYAWAVQSGDVSAIPVPAAVWLFGSGLLGLIGFARRKANA